MMCLMMRVCSLKVVEYDEKPDLETMQSWTKSGTIEVLHVVHDGKECHAIIDEEGKFDNSNENQ